MDGLLKVNEEESDATIKTGETADFDTTASENYWEGFDFIKSEEMIIPSTSADTQDPTTFQETYKNYLNRAVHYCSKCQYRTHKSNLSQVRCGDDLQTARYFCKKCLSSKRRKYPCSKRDKVLSSQKAIREHKLSSHLQEYVSTSGCDDYSEMKAYIEYHGGKPVEFKCDTCKQVFSEKEKLISHIWDRHVKGKRRKYPCSTCDKVLGSQKAMREHKLSSHPQQYICVVCQSVFNSQTCLHYDYIHTHRANSICGYPIMSCGNIFERKEDLIKHFASEHCAMTRFACIECKAILTDKKKLKMHFNYYHASKDLRGENQIRCEICERIFAHETSLKMHVSNQHSRKTFFVCVVCKTVFNEQNKLEAHFEEVHDGAETTFSCADCKRSFANEAHYKKHGNAICVSQRAVSASDLRGENQIRCKICERTFAHETNLEMHVRSQHSRKTSYVCVVCKTVFNEKNKLEAHFEEEHDGAETTFSCAECKRSFANEAQYKNHGNVICVSQRAVSASDLRGENQIRCKICERTFAHETNLKIHVSRQHSRKTIFVCVVCKTVFNEQNKLEAHFEEEHDGAKTTFSCAKCKRSFANEAHYKKHGNAICVSQRAVSANGRPLH